MRFIQSDVRHWESERHNWVYVLTRVHTNRVFLWKNHSVTPFRYFLQTFYKTTKWLIILVVFNFWSWGGPYLYLSVCFFFFFWFPFFPCIVPLSSLLHAWIRVPRFELFFCWTVLLRFTTTNQQTNNCDSDPCCLATIRIKGAALQLRSHTRR